MNDWIRSVTSTKSKTDGEFTQCDRFPGADLALGPSLRVVLLRWSGLVGCHGARVCAPVDTSCRSLREWRRPSRGPNPVVTAPRRFSSSAGLAQVPSGLLGDPAPAACVLRACRGSRRVEPPWKSSHGVECRIRSSRRWWNPETSRAGSLLPIAGLPPSHSGAFPLAPSDILLRQDVLWN